jgi:hypothetical protein
MSLFLALIEWFYEMLKFTAAAAFGAMIAFILIAFGVIQVERKREE